MGRILFIMVIVIAIGYALSIFATYTEAVAIEPYTQSATILEAVTILSDDFTTTGTLAFYPNNIGPVPYIFYQDRVGHTVSKALVFTTGSPYNFSSWSGAHISVTGQTEGEHVIVSRISYISAP